MKSFADRRYRCFAAGLIVSLLGGCHTASAPEDTVTCSNPKTCYSMISRPESSCRLPTDPAGTQRNATYLVVNTWGSPAQDLKIGIARQRRYLNDQLISEEPAQITIYPRTTTNYLGCNLGIEGGNPVKYTYRAACEVFSSDTCIPVFARPVSSSPPPAACLVTIRDRKLKDGIERAFLWVKDDSKFPISSSDLSAPLPGQNSCLRNQVTLNNAGKVVENSGDTCSVEQIAPVNGTNTRFQITIPSIVRAARDVTTNDVALRFEETLAPIVVVKDNPNIVSQFSGTISGITIRKTALTITITRPDGTDACIAVRSY